MKYVDPQTLNLDFPMFFSAMPSDKKDSNSEGTFHMKCALESTVDYFRLKEFDLIDPMSFVGMIKNVRIMIRQLKVLEYMSPLLTRACQTIGTDSECCLHYAQANATQLRSLVRFWAYHNWKFMNRSDVGVDTNYKMFLDITATLTERVSFENNNDIKQYYDVPAFVDVMKNESELQKEHRKMISQLLTAPSKPGGFFGVNVQILNVSKALN